VLWSGYVFLRREQVRRGLPLFVGHTLLLLAVNEWLLPATPLKTASSERALKSAEVLSIRDEAVTTAAGDPIGLRLVFEVRFARRIVGIVSASAFATSETEPPWMPGVLDFDGYEQTIQPSSGSQSMRRVFEKDVVYRVEVTRMPGVRGVDFLTRRPCRNISPGLSETEILAALRRRGNRRYRGDPREQRRCAGERCDCGIRDVSVLRPGGHVPGRHQERLEPCPR